MKTEPRRVLVVLASATAVAAAEVLLVAGGRRMRRNVGGWPFSDDGTARTTQWAHVLLAEALAASHAEWVAVQAKWVQRQFPTPDPAAAIVDRPIAGQCAVVIDRSRTLESTP
jgi:hypothetical protein